MQSWRNCPYKIYCCCVVQGAPSPPISTCIRGSSPCTSQSARNISISKYEYFAPPLAAQRVVPSVTRHPPPKLNRCTAEAEGAATHVHSINEWLSSHFVRCSPTTVRRKNVQRARLSRRAYAYATKTADRGWANEMCAFHVICVRLLFGKQTIKNGYDVHISACIYIGEEGQFVEAKNCSLFRVRPVSPHIRTMYAAFVDSGCRRQSQAVFAFKKNQEFVLADYQEDGTRIFCTRPPQAEFSGQHNTYLARIGCFHLPN